jgi:hypothetical protein
MRGLFLLLLLSNLIYLAVLFFTGTSDTELDPYRGVTFEKKGLTLLAELPPEKRPALRAGIKPEPGLAPWPEEEAPNKESETAAADTQSATEARCLRVGGIRSENQLQSLRLSLRKLGAEEFHKGGEAGAASGNTKFWVMLPPYPDLNKATEAAGALKAMKVKDFFVVRNGEYANAVSLGVFSTRARAQRRLEQISTLKGRKLKAKIETIGSSTSSEYFWLSFKLGDEASPAKIRGMLHRQGLSKLEEISCK